MFIPLFALMSIFGNSGCTDKDEDTTPVIVPIEDKGWTFSSTPVWSDEFDVPGKPDATKWTYEIGNSGWGNNELQYYTKGDNVSIEDGIMTIEARKEEKSGASYTSTRLITRNFGNWLYGRFEARMKLPTGKGTWPAFWMLPTDNSYGNWPKSGEIDIMEHVGYDPNKVHVSIHTESFNHSINTQKTSSKDLPTATSDFHVYRVDWTPYAVRGYVDDVRVFEFINNNTGYAAWPFNKKFFLLLNMAVGGNWGGAMGVDASTFPAKMYVDYVRVYSLVN
ncbi:MAG TPA: glycoside hydrolase family 16 protein [Catalimonadaceae bacterium]|nr:glycoside hydrolase family 16 protein [Catalimonadaceae bacterium]